MQVNRVRDSYPTRPLNCGSKRLKLTSKKCTTVPHSDLFRINALQWFSRERLYVFKHKLVGAIYLYFGLVFPSLILEALLKGFRLHLGRNNLHSNRGYMLSVSLGLHNAAICTSLNSCEPPTMYKYIKYTFHKYTDIEQIHDPLPLQLQFSATGRFGHCTSGSFANIGRWTLAKAWESPF